MATSIAANHIATVVAEQQRESDPLLGAIVRPVPGSGVPAPTDMPTFVTWAITNKLPLLSIPQHTVNELRADQHFREAYDAEAEMYHMFRAQYQIVRDAWEERGVRSLMIKSAGNAPAFPHTSDNIDILVHEADGIEARRVLRELGYVELRNVEEPQKFLFRKFHAGRCVSAIHVHEQITWFVGFLDDRRVWQRSRPAETDPDVIVPSPEDAILINLAHACYENKLLRLNDMIRVRHALLESGGQPDWAYMTQVASSRGWGDGLAFMLLVYAHMATVVWGESLIDDQRLRSLEQMIQTDRPVWQRLTEIRNATDVRVPLDLSYIFCKRLYYRKILADQRRTARERARDVAVTLIWGIKLKSGIRPQPGFVVSISGPDGSGKTAHAEALVEAFQLCELRARYVWTRGGSSGLFRLAGRALTRSVANQSSDATDREDAITRRQRRLKHPVVRAAWAWSVAAEQLASTYLRVWLPARRGSIVVTDRYAYDTVVEMDASLPTTDRVSRMALSALLRLTPRSNLSVVLDISQYTARQRKPDEIWHATFDAERDAYQELAANYGLYLLSTEGHFAASNDALLRRAIMMFMARYETRANALLFSNPTQKNVPDPFWRVPHLAGGIGR
jgi:thymidylate kinase